MLLRCARLSSLTRRHTTAPCNHALRPSSLLRHCIQILPIPPITHHHITPHSATQHQQHTMGAGSSRAAARSYPTAAAAAAAAAAPELPLTGSVAADAAKGVCWSAPHECCCPQQAPPIAAVADGGRSTACRRRLQQRPCKGSATTSRWRRLRPRTARTRPWAACWTGWGAPSRARPSASCRQRCVCGWWRRLDGCARDASRELWTRSTKDTGPHRCLLCVRALEPHRPRPRTRHQHHQRHQQAQLAAHTPRRVADSSGRLPPDALKELLELQRAGGGQLKAQELITK